MERGWRDGGGGGGMGRGCGLGGDDLPPLFWLISRQSVCGGHGLEHELLRRSPSAVGLRKCDLPKNKPTLMLMSDLFYSLGFDIALI